MRRATWLLVGLIGVSLALFSTASAATSEAQEEIEERVRLAKIGEAALRAVEASIEDLRHRLASDEAIAATLMADVAGHREVEISRASVRGRERRELEEAFAEQLRVFARHREDLPPRWAEEVMTRERARVDSAVEALLAAHFEAAYARGRKLAVRRQSQALDAEIRTAHDEVEALAGPAEDFLGRGREAIPKLISGRGRPVVARHVKRVRGARSLFEENEAALEKRVEDALGQGLRVYWRQLRTVAGHDGGGARERTAILDLILEEAGQLGAERRAVPRGVFPVARARAQIRALELEAQLFEDFVRVQLGESCPGLPPERVRGEAGIASLPAHFETHLAERARALRGDTERQISGAWAAPLATPAQRSRFARRLEDLLAERGAHAGSEVKSAFQEGFARCLEAPLRALRAERARRELAHRYPSIADGTFELRDHALDRLHEDLELDPGDFPDGRELHLDEARQELTRLREVFAQEGRAAVQGQLGLAGQRARRDRFRAAIAVDLDRSESRKHYWQKRFEKDVLGAWRTRFGGDRYQRVLAPTVRRIEDIIVSEWSRPGQQPRAESPARRAPRQAPQEQATANRSRTAPAPGGGGSSGAGGSGGLGGAGGSGGSGGGGGGDGAGGEGDGAPPSDDEDDSDHSPPDCVPTSAAHYRCRDASAACERALGRCELCLASSPYCVDLRGDCGQAIRACRDARQQCSDTF